MRTNTTMKLTALAAAMGFVMSSGAFAATEATHDVSVLVSAINEITVDQTEVAFVIDGDSTTEGLSRVETLGSSWGIFTNTATSIGVSAKLDEVVGTGLTLEVSATPPAGAGAALPSVVLGVADVPVVQAIVAVDALANNPLALSYKLLATREAPALYTNTVTVTYTLTDI